VGKELQLKGLLGSGNAMVVRLPASFNLAREITPATSLKLATAFGHMSGRKSIRNSIHQSRGSIKLLTGLSFCQTEPALLTEWLELSRSGRAQARLFTRRDITFHPKVI